jgi:hypothetical protein
MPRSPLTHALALSGVVTIALLASALRAAAQDTWTLETDVWARDLNCPGDDRTAADHRAKPPRAQLDNAAGRVFNVSHPNCEGTSDALGIARLRQFHIQATHSLNVNSPAFRCDSAEAQTFATGVGKVVWPGRADGTVVPYPLRLKFSAKGRLRTTCPAGTFAFASAEATIVFAPRNRTLPNDTGLPPDIESIDTRDEIGHPETLDARRIVARTVGVGGDVKVGDKWDYVAFFRTFAEADSFSSNTTTAAAGSAVPFSYLLQCLPGSGFRVEGFAGANSLPFVDFGGGAPCADGSVNGDEGPITDVLRVNGTTGGEARTVDVAVRQPITVGLSSSPQGPTIDARYWFWLWQGPGVNPTDLVVGGRRLGCTVNPTPFDPVLLPRAFRCFHAAFEDTSAVCGSVRILPVPASADFAPWTLSRPNGFARPLTLTIQGVLEDRGAGNDLDLSVTNAITVRVLP